MRLPAILFLSLSCSLASGGELTADNCGIFPENRIIGGKHAKEKAHPFMVSLQEDYNGSFQHVCGGAVLNEYWIITAAHCIDYINDPWRYRVLLGLHKLSKQNTATGQNLMISKIVVHKEFDEETYHNDIALLRTAQPINISGSKGYINGICLPTTDRDPTGYAKIIGWGHTMEDGENSNTLKEVVVPIIPRDLCNESYDLDPYDEFDKVIDTMICAGMNRKDSCQYDSGGPLFQTDRKGVSTIIGVVSHGAGCGLKKYPGVYTKVASFRSWIEKVVTK